MKKLLIASLLLLSTYSQAQDVRFTASAFTDPIATAKDGFNIGAAIEYQMSISYFKVQVFSFPDLKGTDYFHLQATVIGFNYHNMWKDLRIYGGGKIGAIYRGANPHPTYGGEMGLEWYPQGSGNGFYVGVEGSLDWREDFKFSDAEAAFQHNGAIKVGYSF